MAAFKRGQQVGTKIFPLDGRVLYERATLIHRDRRGHVPGYWHVKFAKDGARLCIHESSMVDWAEVSSSSDYHRQNARAALGE